MVWYDDDCNSYCDYVYDECIFNIGIDYFVVGLCVFCKIFL